eukprot:12417727-Alexandrium_andersonii.AAC.1
MIHCAIGRQGPLGRLKTAGKADHVVPRDAGSKVSPTKPLAYASTKKSRRTLRLYAWPELRPVISPTTGSRDMGAHNSFGATL